MSFCFSILVSSVWKPLAARSEDGLFALVWFCLIEGRPRLAALPQHPKQALHSTTPHRQVTAGRQELWSSAMRFTPGTLTFFLFLIIGGHVLLPLLLAASIISREAHRNPTFLSWIIAWMIYSVSMCLLWAVVFVTSALLSFDWNCSAFFPCFRLYSGENLLYSQPPKSLCLIQAALNYSSIVLWDLIFPMFTTSLIYCNTIDAFSGLWCSW